MTGVEGNVNTADNTQELAELFDATLKFTSVLKKKGVSQSTLTVRTALRQKGCAIFIFSKLAVSVFNSPAGSSAMPTTDAQGEELWLPPDNTPSRRQGQSCSSPVNDLLQDSRQTYVDACHSLGRFAIYWKSSLSYLQFVKQ